MSPFGVLRRKPRAWGGTCALNFPYWQNAAPAETSRISAGPSTQSRAPWKKSISATPLFKRNKPGGRGALTAGAATAGSHSIFTPRESTATLEVVASSRAAMFVLLDAAGASVLGHNAHAVSPMTIPAASAPAYRSHPLREEGSAVE